MAGTPNPAKETMTRLGACSMIIDPHVFEVTLYTVKDFTPNYAPPPTQPPSLSAPQYNPFAQGRAYAPPYIPPPTSHLSYPAQPHTQPSQHSLPPFREGFGSFGPQGPPPIYHPPVRTPPPVRSAAPATVSGPPNLPRMGSTDQGTSQAENGEPKPDPVIKMLATRAASDPGLKTLMKVVASGKASQPQLREFQDHIDELNSVLKARCSPPQPFGIGSNADGPPPTPTPSRPSNACQRSSEADFSWNQRVTGAPNSSVHQTLPPIKLEPSSQPYALAPTPPITKASGSNKSDINGVVFDFGGTGDRFSIPRFSILEYLYGGTQVIISFIVIRRGNTAASGNYKGTMNYYQPVTLRLSTPQPRILEPLARAVAPPDKVRTFMNNYFDRLSPAENVYLATRLPRATEAEDCGKGETPMQPDGPQTRKVYLPPNSVMPLAA